MLAQEIFFSVLNLIVNIVIIRLLTFPNTASNVCNFIANLDFMTFSRFRGF